MLDFLQKYFYIQIMWANFSFSIRPFELWVKWNYYEVLDEWRLQCLCFHLYRE